MTCQVAFIYHKNSRFKKSPDWADQVCIHTYKTIRNPDFLSKFL